MASAPIESSASPEAHPANTVPHLPERKQSRGSKAADKIRRRNRTINSCLECRRRKLKCDKNLPCASCAKFGRECRYLQGGAENPEAAREIAHLKEQLAGLEKSFEDRLAGSVKPERPRLGELRSPSLPGLEDSEGSEEEAMDDERDLEPTPLATVDAAYYEDADDDLMDLGVQFGKFRMTERIGGFVRPKILDELKHYVNETPSDKTPEDPNSPEAIAERRIRAVTDYLGPTTAYVAPSSNLVFGGDSKFKSIDEFLFAKAGCDLLIKQYFDAVHYMCRVVHRPTFERQYESFWRSRTLPGSVEQPTNSFIATMMAAMLSAIISMSEEQVIRLAGNTRTQSQLVEHFRLGTEFALARANFIRTTKLETLQAFVMYLIPLCRAEVSRAHSALTGTAIRLAECMGLHRDGSLYGLRPVETHVRRLVWYQLCFLDLRTCEATGPRPQIRSEDFDTKFPLNVDDRDLESSHPPYEDAERWTDCTFSRMRFECNEMQRLIHQEAPRVEAKKTSLTSLLSKVKNFWDATEKKYIPMIDKRSNLHCMALLTYRALTYKMHIRVLHRYCSNPDRIMPERLRQVLLSSGLAQLEHAIAIETSPQTKTWAWYSGAFQQYHTALLIMGEVYSTPQSYQHKDRVWKCLDYVFDLPPNAHEGHKARIILSELQRRMEVYQRHRKIRAPMSMTGRTGPRPVPSILKQQAENSQASLLPAGYILGSPTGVSVPATPPVRDNPEPQTSPAVSDVQFGTAPTPDYTKSPYQTNFDEPMFSFVHPNRTAGRPYGAPTGASSMAFSSSGSSALDSSVTKAYTSGIALANSTDWATSPAALSDSSGGAPSIGTATASAQMKLNLGGLASAAGGSGAGTSQPPMVGSFDNMDIDWDEVNRLFPASEWESGAFPLSNMGLDFGQPNTDVGMGFQ